MYMYIKRQYTKHDIISHNVAMNIAIYSNYQLNTIQFGEIILNKTMLGKSFPTVINK